MSKPDARFLSKEVQEYLREQAIRLRQEGKRFKEISQYLGVHRNTVSQWWRQYLTQGESALYQQVRGRSPGEKRTLSRDEEMLLQQLLFVWFPNDLGIDSALWTRRSLQALIQQKYGVKMPIRTVGEYLRRWGYTPQKPLRRAYEQDPKAVKEWLWWEYPLIEQRAAQEGAEIAWGDESGLRSDAQVGRSYAPAGETPEIHLSTRRVRVNFIASISNQGQVQFMLITKKLSALVFIKFLERLLQGRKRRLFWIVDNHPVHHSKTVQQWLAQHQEQIELFHLPSYSPELNPVEYLNCDVKHGVHSKPPTRNLSELKHCLLSHLHKLPGE